MGASENPPPPRRWIRHRRAGVVVAAMLLGGAARFALSRLGLHRIGHALITAKPGWVALAFVLMASSLVLRSISWHETLRAALPGHAIPWVAVTRATMIGVMASAVVPGRVGEPTRVVVLTPAPGRRQPPAAADRRRHGLLADADQPARAGDSRRDHVHERAAAQRPPGRDRDGDRDPAADLPRSWSPGRACSRSAAARALRAARRPRARSRPCFALARRGPDRVRAPALRRAARSPSSCSPGRCSGWPATRCCSRSACSTRPGWRPPRRSCSPSTCQRDPAGDAVQRRRLPGRLPGRAGRLRRRRRPRPGLRDHPAGGRGR